MRNIISFLVRLFRGGLTGRIGSTQLTFRVGQDRRW